MLILKIILTLNAFLECIHALKGLIRNIFTALYSYLFHVKNLSQKKIHAIKTSMQKRCVLTRRTVTNASATRASYGMAKCAFVSASF